MAEISSQAGSRTAWHNHQAGQYLYVTGVGWVQSRSRQAHGQGGRRGLDAARGFHWHGATATQGARAHRRLESLDGGETGNWESTSPMPSTSEPADE